VNPARHSPTAALALCLALLVAGGCARSDGDAPVLERIELAPARLVVYGEGTLNSTRPAPLVVPGTQFSKRQLRWLLPDGSWVKAGDVVARFSAEESKMNLASALVELQRNALARQAKETELGDAQGKLTVDIDQVIGQLGIAHRYANATEVAIARNDILDAVQDEHFLGVKQDTLNWRKDQSSTRGQAELALIEAQRATNEVLAKQNRDDLSALEVRAPNEGLFVLQPDWSGEKPKLGAAMWAGFTFATLPDIASMEVEIWLPQVEAHDVRDGMAVDLAPLGAPEQKLRANITFVAAAASVRSRESPVKYLSMKATVPAAAVAEHHWVPGQRFRAAIVLFESDRALTVPNIALTTSGDVSSVTVRDGARSQVRTLHLGVRGPSRTQVLDGLQAGETIVLGAGAAGAGKAGDTTVDKSGAAAPQAPP
jgi:hypothetical protein